MVSGAARSPTLSSRAHATPRARSPTCPPRNRQATARKQRENANRGGHKASGQSGNSTHAGQSKKVLKRTKRTARALDSHPKKNAGACYEHAPAPKKTKDPRGGARPQRPSKKGRHNLLPQRGVQDRSGAEKKVNKKHKVRGAGKTVVHRNRVHLLLFSRATFAAESAPTGACSCSASAAYMPRGQPGRPAH